MTIENQSASPARQSANYKLLLFQTVYHCLKTGANLPNSVPDEIADFYELIRRNPKLIAIFCKIVEQCLLHNAQNAFFLADKLLSLTADHSIAAFILGDIYFQLKEYIKVSYLFEKHNLILANENYLILTAKAYLQGNQWEQALKILSCQVNSPLNDPELLSEIACLSGKCMYMQENRKDAESSYLEALSLNPVSYQAFEGFCEIRGSDQYSTPEQIDDIEFPEEFRWMKEFYNFHLAMSFDLKEHKNSALIELSKSMTAKGKEDRMQTGMDSFIFGDQNSQMTLTNNTFNQSQNPMAKKQASQMLIETNSQEMLHSGTSPRGRRSKPSIQEETIQGLSFGKPMGMIDEERGSRTENEIDPIYQADPILLQLWESQNVQLLFLKAKKAFANFQINTAYEICKLILDKDYFYFDNLLLYSELLVEKSALSELFSCSTTLAENYPNHYVTFHMFGMYNFLLKKYDVARKFFNNALQLNKYCLQSWLMLGHSYAYQEESEHAMNIYRSCVKIFPNSHLPHIYMGMEYLRINSLKTSLLSFNQAKSIAGPNPVIYNEIGCIYLKEKKYSDAKKAFNKALKNCQEDGINWLQHIILNNLGNAHRKFKEYKLAIDCYEKSLSLCPNDPAVTFSLAFCYHLTGNLSKSIGLYHKVVTLKYDTHFVNQMLINSLSDLAEKNFELFK